MSDIKVFGRIARPMQRLGYLKRLIKRVASTASSSLDNVGNDLVDVALKKVRVPLTPERVTYIKIRLFDQAYKTLKQQADEWLKQGGDAPEVLMELQDVYLADPSLPSQVGKLVRDNWKKYPWLGVNLGLIREGTYSINTRGLSLLYYVTDDEQHSFTEYLPNANPFKLSISQGLLLLYSCIENDGDVFIRLIHTIINEQLSSFSDRDAGNFLPEIYLAIVSQFRGRALAIELRERLQVISENAQRIVDARKSDKYTGGGIREESSRPRLEPYVDIGLFTKPNPLRYEYTLSPVGLAWAAAVQSVDGSAAIDGFLKGQYFSTAAQAWQIPAQPLTDRDDIVQRLRQSAQVISSSSGYTPIEELALLAGIDALVQDHLIIEQDAAREALLAYQKEHPYEVRFTVDRMNKLAYARFMDGVVGS